MENENTADAIRRNHDRLSALESLIPMTERQLSRLPSSDPHYAVLRNKLDEYQLEFRERTGTHFQPLHSDDVTPCRITTSNSDNRSSGTAPRPPWAIG